MFVNFVRKPLDVATWTIVILAGNLAFKKTGWKSSPLWKLARQASINISDGGLAVGARSVAAFGMHFLPLER